MNIDCDRKSFYAYVTSRSSSRTRPGPLVDAQGNTSILPSEMAEKFYGGPLGPSLPEHTPHFHNIHSSLPKLTPHSQNSLLTPRTHSTLPKLTLQSSLPELTLHFQNSLHTSRTPKSECPAVHSTNAKKWRQNSISEPLATTSDVHRLGGYKFGWHMPWLAMPRTHWYWLMFVDPVTLGVWTVRTQSVVMSAVKMALNCFPNANTIPT